MPLQMGGVSTARPQTVLWDPNISEQEKDAKKRIDVLIRQGFKPSWFGPGEAKLLPPKRDENTGCFRILSDNGDDVIVWDRRDKNQVKEAFKKFKDLIKKGYSAYASLSDGSRGHKITEFDPSLQEIILGAKEAILVPSTVPG